MSYLSYLHQVFVHDNERKRECVCEREEVGERESVSKREGGRERDREKDMRTVVILFI